MSPLGVGIKSATILTRYLDARMLANYFNYNLNDFDLEGFQGSGSVHFFSMGAALDAYPRNSIWRLSGGVMMHNGNNFSATGEAEPGQSFSLNKHTFYSAKPNAAIGAIPLMDPAFWFSTRANLSSSSAEDSADSFPTRSGTGPFPPSSAFSLWARPHSI